MAISEKSNQGLMKAIKRMHTLVESDDLERVRASQENISALLKHRELNYEPFQVGENSVGMGQCEAQPYAEVCDFLLSWRRLQYRQFSLCQKHYQQIVEYYFHGCAEL